ncbi:MAG: OmpP1/FadL family transporter [Limisphaerales bacterium]
MAGTEWSPCVRANGVERNGAGARAMALGGASVASPEAPLEALAVNPAGFRESQLQVGGWGATVDGTFSNAANDGGDLGGTLGVAPEVALSMPLGTSPVTLGLGVIPVAAAGLDWQLVDAPGGLDGVTSYGLRRHHAEFLAIRSAVGASVALGESVSLGAAVGATYNRNRLEAPYVFQSHPVLRGFKTLLDLETEGWGVDGTFGVVYRPCPGVSLGLSYRTPTAFETSGDAEGNAGAQLTSLGGAFAGVRPDFHYDARVSTSLPQSVVAGLSWQARDWLRLVVQVDWLDWSDAFDRLDVTLTGGNNADLNGFLGSSRIDDTVPLDWDDRWVYRAGAEFTVAEGLQVRVGYAYGESPIPDGTLTPMSAAILEHTVTAGIEWRRNRWGIALAYQYDFGSERAVGTSRLSAGEYSGSTTDLESHVLGLTTTFRF